METGIRKPRLIYFQGRHEGLPEFLLLHLQLHVKCLSEFFDVILINRDCDYRQVCDTYKPDLTLFESGYKSTISKRITITNTCAYPEIPKLGLHNGDGWCECRTGFIADMEQWGIENFFSISTTTAEYTPDIAENLFVWPNFIDSDIYRDYKQTKIVPILFNGSMISLYPWRQKIYKTISGYYPSLIFPHLGYENRSSIMIHGEQYARTINASWFVPSCGTVTKEVVRKHFEIPGSKSCLITEKTPSLEAAGFVDMQNCVFADEKNVLDKLNYLFQNTGELEQIINAGYSLVHSRHTLKHRDQIFQWFNLNKNIKPNERIVQVSPFEPLRIIEKSSGIKNTHIACNGITLVLLRQGDEKLWEHKYDEAEALYLKCLNYISWMSEPKLKLAICNLHKGSAKNALNWIIEPIQNNLGIYKLSEPDPIEWAYFIISLLCEGNLSEATIRANQFRSINHPELNRARLVIEYLQNKGAKILISHDQLPRYSIHQLPQLSFDDWINNLSTMLKACQQLDYANVLSNMVSLKKESQEKPGKKSGDGTVPLKKYLLSIRISCIEKLNYVFEALHIPNRRQGLPSISINDYIIRLAKWVKVDPVKKFVSKYLSQLKGSFHLYRSSESAEISNDEFLQAVQHHLEEEDVQTAIIISTSIDSLIPKTILNKKQTGYNEPTIVCINILNTQLAQLKDKHTENCNCKIYELAFSSSESFSSELNDRIKKIKQENKISFFDLVVIDSPGFNTNAELAELAGARFVILNEINSLSNYRNKQELILDLGYTIVAQNPLHKKGYAIFKRFDKTCLPDFSSFDEEKPFIKNTNTAALLNS